MCARENESVSWAYRKKFLDAQKKFEANEYEEAEKLYSELCDGKEKAVPEALLHRAFTRLRMNKLGDALNDINQCIELRPDNGVMFMIQGEILLAQKDYMASYSALKKCCEMEKDNGRAHYNLGKAALGLGRKDEASEYFEIALQFEKQYTMSQFMTELLSK